MPTVTLELPSMIATVLGGVRRIEVEGGTCHEALEDAFTRHPGLRVHVFDENGALRQHVLCFVNEDRWDVLDKELAEGDTITILQAVSGG